MSIPIIQGTGSCCAAAAKGSRLVVFPDGCQVAVNGLDSIFDEAYGEGKSADRSVAGEMVSRLSENNFIPSSAWSEYEDVVLREYQKFLDTKEERDF